STVIVSGLLLAVLDVRVICPKYVAGASPVISTETGSCVPLVVAVPLGATVSQCTGVETEAEALKSIDPVSLKIVSTGLISHPVPRVHENTGASLIESV